jgi:hypothetical protein
MMQPHDSLLSQAYREAAHPEPTPALDARILAAARQAVVPQRRRPSWFGWAVPLSTMAVLVLGIGLLFRMQLEAPETLREDMPPLPALESDASPAPSQAQAPAAQAKLEARLQDQDDRTPPAPRMAATPHETAANKAKQAPAASAPMEAEVAAAIAPMIEAMPAPMPPLKFSSDADVAAVQAPAAAPAPAAAAGASLAKESAIRAEKESAAKAVSPSAAPVSAARLKQGMSRMQAATPLMESPEQWVESIRKMLREGQIEAARTRLQELRKRFPDFPLPPDLEPSRCCPLPATSAE